MQDDGYAFYRRFLNGDKGALELLIALHGRGLYQFILGYVRDKGVAEDVLQEVFIRLYTLRSFEKRRDGSLKSYLYEIAKNESLNALKKRKRMREISLDALTKENAPRSAVSFRRGFFYPKLERFEPQTPAEDLEEKSEKEELSRSVFAALSRIKKEYRQALFLRYFDGVSPKRIAKIMNKDVKQVYNLLARGRAALKDELQEKKQNL